MLAKIVNDDAENLTPRGDLRFFASKLAPTESGSVFDLDLRRPVKPRWPERGHTEPERGAEWWGKSPFGYFGAFFQSDSL